MVILVVLVFGVIVPDFLHVHLRGVTVDADIGIAAFSFMTINAVENRSAVFTALPVVVLIMEHDIFPTVYLINCYTCFTAIVTGIRFSTVCRMQIIVRGKITAVAANRSTFCITDFLIVFPVEVVLQLVNNDICLPAVNAYIRLSTDSLMRITIGIDIFAIPAH